MWTLSIGPLGVHYAKVWLDMYSINLDIVGNLSNVDSVFLVA